MDITNFLRLVNTLLAIMTIPPALGVLFHVTSEAKVIPTATTTLNKILRVSFVTLAVSAMLNAALSFMLLIGYDFELFGEYSQYLFNSRNLVHNIGSLIISWGFLIVIRKANER